MSRRRTLTRLAVAATLTVAAAMQVVVGLHGTTAAHAAADDVDRALGLLPTCTVSEGATTTAADPALARLLTDGDDTTAATFQGGVSDTLDGRPYNALECTVDLGVVTQIAGFEVVEGTYGVPLPGFFNESRCSARNNTGVAVSSSEDGVTYQRIGVDAAERQVDAGQTLDGTGGIGRYFRIRIEACWSADRGGADTFSLFGPAQTTMDAVGGDLEAPGADACVPLRLADVKYLLPDGTLSDVPGVGSATVYDFDMGGSLVPQIVPPIGFSPTAATDAQLEMYGMETRPTDPDALADWTEAYSHWTGAAQPGMCRGLSNNNVTSSNWNGVVNAGGGASGFRKSSGTFVQPTFAAVCSHASSHSIWTGLGGAGDWEPSIHLLQQGTSVAQSGLNDTYAWWQAISPQHNTFEVRFSNLTVATGNTIRPSTSYTPASSGVQASATMSVYDVSTGRTATMGPVHGIDGYPIQYYYYGSTSEFIDERPGNSGLKYPVDGQYYYLRKFNSNPLHWSQTLTNGSSSYNTYREVTDMVRPNGTRLADVRNGLASNSSFNAYWDACA
jgi:hypothetical protein